MTDPKSSQKSKPSRAAEVATPDPDRSAEDTQGRPEGLWHKILWVMARVEKLEKTGVNETQKYRFVEEANVLAQIRPLLVRAGLVLTHDVLSSEQLVRKGKSGDVYDLTKVYVQYKLVDADTGQEHVWHGVGFGQDALDKGPYKALTGAHKYAVTKTFQLSTGDADPEQDTGDDGGPVVGGKNRSDYRRTDAKRGNGRQEPTQQEEQGEEDPLDQPAKLESVAKGHELAKNPLLPPKLAAHATEWLGRPNHTERQVLVCIATLEADIKKAEEAEEAAFEEARKQQEAGGA